ncbi:MAG: hypothetical protein HY319_06665 [Armatimonadetes bacterium]|nr:hypothetical protein [Armatimonadota bacterium]
MREQPVESWSGFCEQVELYVRDRTTAEAVLYALEQFHDEIADMHDVFHRERCFRLHDEAILEPAAAVYEAYQALYEFVDCIRDGLETGASDLPELVAEMAVGLETIFELYARLRDHDERSPRHSEAPYVHELLRVGYACLDRKLPWEALRDRLEAFGQLHEGFCSALALDQWRLTAAQTETAGELLEAQTGALRELEAFFEHRDPGAVGPALEAIQASTGGMLALHQAPEGPSLVCCPRCGRDTPRAERYCSCCSAILPSEPGRSLQPWVDVRLEDHGIVATRGELPEHLQSLLGAGEAFVAGVASAEALGALVDGMRSRASAVRRHLALVGSMSKDVPDELSGLLEEAKVAAFEGFEGFQAALEDLGQGAEREDPGMVRHALAELTRAADILQRIDGLAADIRQRLTKPG